MVQKVRKSPYRCFNQWLCLSTLLGVIGVGGFNAVVDPYGVLGSPTTTSFNRLKPKQINHVRLFKAAEITRIKPTAVLMGSSRVDIGLDPSHPQLAQFDSAYNVGLSGANMHEVRQYFEHAIANQPDLELAVIGLDFFMFNTYKTDEIDFSLQRLQRQHVAPKDMFNVTLSVDALESSIDTIGFNLRPSPLSLYSDTGQRYDFKATPPDREKEFVQMTTRLLEREGYYLKYELSESFLDELQTVVDLAKANDIELKLFISPAHATLTESLRMKGLWRDYEEWKQAVVAIAPVWDFSGYNSITTEALSNEMRYYVDSSHYSTKVGNMILSRLLSETPPSNAQGGTVASATAGTIPNDFGIWLTPENVDEQSDRIANARIEWRKTYTDDLRFVYQP